MLKIDWTDLDQFATAIFGEPLHHNTVALTAIITSHVCHFLSVLVLHRLCQMTITRRASETTAFLIATLHVFAPAGLFLSAPYGESAFSLLNFLGYYLYIHGLKRRALLNDASILGAGALFGAATTIRSNGIINGVLFAMDALILGPHGALQNLRFAASLICGGLLNALGSALPQYKAYQLYCTEASGGQGQRPWCTALVPSVYSFVQSHYWSVRCA